MEFSDYHGLVNHLSAKYKPRCLDYDDAFQEGWMAFNEAVRTYDEERASFKTHLGHTIRWHMMQCAKQGEGEIKTPRNVKPVYADVRLDEVIHSTESDMFRHEVIPDDDAVDPSEAVAEKDLQLTLLSFANDLSFVEQVIYQRRLLHPEFPRYVAKDLEMTRQGLHYYETRLRTKLKKFLESNGYGM